MPYPPNPMIGSAMNPSSSSAAGADALMQNDVPDLPAFRGQQGVMTIQPPANAPQFGQPQSTTDGPMTAHGPQMHATYAPAHAHYNPQAYQAHVADNRVNAQLADNS